jgi:hypothetical protein
MTEIKGYLKQKSVNFGITTWPKYYFVLHENLLYKYKTSKHMTPEET